MADLFKECPELELLRDYAETCKHAGLDRKNPPVRLVSLTGAEPPPSSIELIELFAIIQSVPTI